MGAAAAATVAAANNCKPALLQIGASVPALRGVLESAYDLYTLGEQEDEATFLAKKGPSIRGVVICEDPDCDDMTVIEKELVSKLPNLEIVSSFDHKNLSRTVDVRLCNKVGVQVTDTRDALTYFSAATAQRLLMAITGEVCCMGQYVRACRWPCEANYGIPYRLCNKHVGVVGLHQIGIAIATQMESLGCTIGYWCTKQNHQYPNYAYYDNVVDLARHSDILIIACPLTQETKKIVNRKVLDALGPLGFMVNVSRGPVVDEEELASALKDGRIAGAGLDVFENDGQVPDELIQFDTCVLQPHPGCSMESQQAKADLVVANLEAHFAGKPLLTPVC
jgi:lactate dehydrogenase-like 2-hydroxyacid dehydrogenase